MHRYGNSINIEQIAFSPAARTSHVPHLHLHFLAALARQRADPCADLANQTGRLGSGVVTFCRTISCASNRST